MISTVEIFDPRTGSWIMGESLKTSRGYFATVVIENSIFVIGGLSENDEILDTVCNISMTFLQLCFFCKSGV